MKVNRTFSDTNLEWLQSVSIKRVTSPGDAVDLESRL